jgi:quercetin dioxygenase-like cupin family protein
MTRVNPNDLSWFEPAPGVRFKSVAHDGRKVRLLEFAPGFAETEWCCHGHIGYVLAGRLEVAFIDRAEVFVPGDFLLIRAGEADKHRARTLDGPVRVFLVDDERV